MPGFLVQLNDNVPTGNLLEGYSAHVVFAGSAADARAAVAAKFNNDAIDWTDTNVVTTTELVADSDFENWTAGIKLYNTSDRLPAETVSVTGGSGDTLDNLGSALVTALNNTGSIANAAYDSSTNVLTVAGTGDGIGDWTFSVTMTPPWGTGDMSSTFISSTTDGGASGDALSLTFVSDGPTIPMYQSGFQAHR